MRRLFNPLIRLFASRKFIRYSIVSLNVLLLGAIGLFTLGGSESSVLVHQQAVQPNGDAASPLDQLSSADIAANASLAVGLYETSGVVNQADSVAAEMAVASTDTTVIPKPQTIATDTKTRAEIQDYTVKPGDTVASIAAQFGITSDSIMWSNGLRNNTIAVNAVLAIPNINGMVYTVRGGDTPDTLAQRFRANKERIITFNDIELTGLKPGSRIIIPGGQLPAPVVVSRIQAVYGYNGYDFGFCTWYVANRRAQIGRPVPANLGNASTWDNRAAAAGLPVNKTPAFGAAVVTSQRGAGHVAFVEQVNADGSIWISEMNSRGQRSMTDPTPAGGWNRIDYKLVAAGTAAGYVYIH